MKPLHLCIILALTVTFLLLLIVSLILYYPTSIEPEPSVSPSGAQSTDAEPAERSGKKALPDTWLEYRNDLYHFGFAYPPSFEVVEQWVVYPEPRGNNLPIYIHLRPIHDASYLGLIDISVLERETPSDTSRIPAMQYLEPLSVTAITDITIDGIPARRVAYLQTRALSIKQELLETPIHRIKVVFATSTLQFEITTMCYKASNVDDIEKCVDTFDSIIGTLRISN